MHKPRLLGVLLCYNDGDMLADAIRHLLNNNHDVLAWNHGSTDETAAVLQAFRRDLTEVTDISRNVDFYDIYALMSKHLIAKYVDKYDWISWPDQDEILEGPTRAKPYHAYLDDVYRSKHSWIQFNDFTFWYTSRDCDTVASPCERVRHYAMRCDGIRKIRSWRASATNIRWFNHNAASGSRYPARFNLRHYPMRSAAQMRRRISVDRAGLQRGPLNFHYEHMKGASSALEVDPNALHLDDGVADLNPSAGFDWRLIFGGPPSMPTDVAESLVLSTKKWHAAGVVQNALANLSVTTRTLHGPDRIDRWRRALDVTAGELALVVFDADRTRIVTVPDAGAIQVSADASRRRITVEAPSGAPGFHARLVAAVPWHGEDGARIGAFGDRAVEFDQLTGTHYVLGIEPQGR